jgi:hypothetical protein
MKTIPDKAIEKIWKRVTEATPEDAQAMLDRMARAQPYAFAYLMAVDETLYDDEQRGQLLLIGLVLWEVLRKDATDRVIAIDEIQAAEAANIKFLESLDAGSEMDYVNGMQDLVASYNQMPLLGAVMEALMEGNEEEPELADENLGLALVHLKSVIDCLDTL